MHFVSLPTHPPPPFPLVKVAKERERGGSTVFEFGGLLRDRAEGVFRRLVVTYEGGDLASVTGETWTRH